MKKFIQHLLLTTFFINLFCISIVAQTNVSGGIYTNTTWTLVNSPYIVVDTVVVFPGVTLTIEPGVVIKFDPLTRLEIRQAHLIAVGTITDSIVFTSNSSQPNAGSWIELYLNNDSSYLFNYCKFEYATTAINRDAGSTQSLTIKNSHFNFNNTGVYSSPNIYAYTYIDSSSFRNNNFAIGFLSKIISISNCIISNNQTGVDFAYSKIENSVIDSNVTGIIYHLNDTVLNCKIRNNDVGLKNPHNTAPGGNVISKNEIENNNYGIWLNISDDLIYCNRICNNTTHNLYYNVFFGSNTDVSDNYWCTTDSATIGAHIYDGYDDISLGLAVYMPIDTLQCYLATSVNELKDHSLKFSIFPNPVTDNLTLLIPENMSKYVLKIFDVLGNLEYSSEVFESTTNINFSKFVNGIYIVEVTDGRNISRQKLIK